VTGLPFSKKTFLDKVCIYTLQLVDSSISPGWLFLAHVQCSVETVNTLKFHWQILHVDKNFGLKKVAHTSEKSACTEIGGDQYSSKTKGRRN